MPSDEWIRELCYDATSIHCWHTAYRSDEANSAAAQIVPSTDIAEVALHRTCEAPFGLPCGRLKGRLLNLSARSHQTVLTPADVDLSVSVCDFVSHVIELKT